jgi:hypothetical protein
MRKMESEEYGFTEPLRLVEQQQSFERQVLTLKKSSIETTPMEAVKEVIDSSTQFGISNATHLKVHMRKQRLT